MKENRFLHISDLHFFKSDHQKGRKDGINHFEIKKKILDYISSIIISDQIGAILISGDLELDSTDHFLPYLINWLGVGSKVFIDFGEHDLRDKRNELIESTKDLSGLYIFDEPRMVNDEALDFCVYGMSCESKQSGFWIVNSKSDRFYKVRDLLNSAGDKYPSVPCKRMLLNQ